MPLHPASDPDGHPEFMKEIGQLCAAWSFLEFITDRMLWRVLEVNPKIGSMLTANKDIGARWSLIINNAGLFVDENELAILQRINTLLATVAIDRNIAVHGQILKHKDTKQVFAVVTRGKHADKHNIIDLPKILTIIKNIKMLSLTATSIGNNYNWFDIESVGEINDDWAKPIEGFP